MKAVQINSLKQYNRLRENRREFVPVIISDNLIFVGPSYRQGQTNSCLGCLLNSLKDNDSAYYPLLTVLLSDTHKPYTNRTMTLENDLVMSYEEDTQNKFHIINRGNMSVKSYPVYQHPACEICERKEKAEDILKKIRYDYVFNERFREKSPEDIMNVIDGFKSLINPIQALVSICFGMSMQRLCQCILLNLIWQDGNFIPTVAPPIYRIQNMRLYLRCWKDMLQWYPIIGIVFLAHIMI